jgi:hypothetical protein
MRSLEHFQQQGQKKHNFKQIKPFFKAGIMPSAPGAGLSAMSHG